jgi:threonine synthase
MKCCGTSDREQIVHAVSRMFMSHLECTRCGKKHDATFVQTVCNCGGVLFARYDLEQVARRISKQALQSRVKSMWRYRELLPVREESNITTLGEGFTPVLRLTKLGRKLDQSNLFMKDDGLIPTGTFKARGMAMAISKSKELGIKKVAVATAGNAGAAMSAYASRADIETYVCIPKDTPEPIRLECEIYGAHVTLVDGTISDAGKIVDEGIEKNGWVNLSTMKEPYRVEGKKTMGFEIAEQFNWALPDVIVYPTGGGTGIVGMWKAFEELEKIGWISGKRPRLVSVQSSGCAPVVKAIRDGEEECGFWQGAQTIAAGLRVPKAYGDYLILKAIRQSHGTAVEVTDQEILAAMRTLASREGLWVCPEGAATYACLNELVASGALDGDETALLYNTGSGILYPDIIA